MAQDELPRPDQLEIATLGPCQFDSPLPRSLTEGDGIGNFVPDDTRVLYDIEFTSHRPPNHQLAFERAGARAKMFFDPAETRAAIVTCGGLCPGMNNVIRTIYYELTANYQVPEVLGIRYGFRGLNPSEGLPPLVLTGDFVDNIHKVGGTVLGTSRGPQEPAVMVDFLVAESINILFCVGGDGTQRGADALCKEIKRRELPISVIGVPKTIDNDIKFVWRTFGFFTALEKATEVIDSAHNEARGVENGIGLVKLMGRESGFIAAGATTASGQVNFALIPEVPFALEGDGGLLGKLERRLRARRHAVIVVAEGAGQDLLSNTPDAYDASGNRKLGDIGGFLRDRIGDHFKKADLHVSIKYLDPSYHIRSVAANCADSLLCDQFGRFAVHAGMAGKTDMLMGLWNNMFVHVPLELATGAKKQISPESDLWASVLSVTGQDRW